MMFTSMAPIRRQRDPRPYKILETGERVTQDAFGTPGVTIVFDPRPKYMLPNSNPVNEVLDRIRDNYVGSSSSWSSSMTWLAVVAGWTEKIFGAVPKEWRTDLPSAQLGALQELVDEIGETKILPQLIHAGNVLQRLAGASQKAGLSFPIERGHDEDDY